MQQTSGIYLTYVWSTGVFMHFFFMEREKYLPCMAEEVFSGLHPSLQEVLANRLGWSEFRDVQTRAYRAVTAGHDVLVIAPTAGGKTEAALIPVLDRILKEGSSGVACLYLSPLKALINDQEERFLSFCTPTGLEVRMWHGDVPRGDRSWGDGEPPHVLMITPESLEVLFGEPALAADLSHATAVIVDELHAFAESERGVHLQVLLDRLDLLAGRGVQRIGLSATVGNPEEVLAWFAGAGRGRELVEVPVPPRARQFTFSLEADENRRMEVLARLVARKKALVFVNSRAEAENVGKALRGKVEQLSVHHSSLSPVLRKAAEEAFSREGSACIVCTSTLELGIDIGDLDVVVQVGPPASVSSFLQRMGRSGRRGKAPFMACLLADPWELLLTAAVIESASRKHLEPLVPCRRPCNVLAQQVLLGIARGRRSPRARLVRDLGALPSFGRLPPGTLELLIRFLETERFLVRDGDMLMPGPRMEELYGRSNWKELYSVIRGGGEFRVVTPEGEQVGRLDARFVTAGGQGSFSLGGRSWTLVKSDESHNLVVVVPGEEGRGRAFWTGSQAGYSPVVCQAVQRLLARGRSLLPLPPAEAGTLLDFILSFPQVWTKGIHVWEEEGKRSLDAVALTFLSRGHNALLAILLRQVMGGKVRVRYDDFSLLFPDLAREDAAGRVVEALEEVKAMETGEVARRLPLPGAETWKFGAALPESFRREMAVTDTWQVEEFSRALSQLPVYRVEPPKKGT